MSRRIITLAAVNCLIVLGVTVTASAQYGPRPGLAFREIWQQTEKGGENPAVQAHVWNPNLELKLYGEEASATTADAGIKITGNRSDSNPIHTWTGVCPSSCGFTLKHTGNMVDLSRGRVTMNIKASGMHQVRPLVKLADGRFFVAEEGAGTFTDWSEHQWVLADQRWLLVDPAKMVTKGQWVTDLDLTMVDEVGYLDLMPGSGHGAGGWTDVAEVEVYGTLIPR